MKVLYFPRHIPSIHDPVRSEWGALKTVQRPSRVGHDVQHRPSNVCSCVRVIYAVLVFAPLIFLVPS